MCGGRYFDWREDWETRPTLVLHPDLRYPESKPMRLGDHEQKPNVTELLLAEVRGLRDRAKVKTRLMDLMPHLTEEEATESVDRFLEGVFAGN